MKRLTVVSISFIIVSLMLTGISDAKIDPDTVVGIWLFDEGKGDIAKDSSENGNDGTFVGDPQWVDGKFGGALEFDGASSYVDCGNDESLDIETGGSVTICAWVYSNIGSTGAWQGILAKRDANYGYGINLITNAFQVYTSGGSGVQGFAYNLPVKEWAFVCGIMSAQPTELYVNGESFGVKGPGGGVISTTNTLRIAASLEAAEIFNGIIDDVSIFNVTLTVDEINDIMNDGLARATGITAVSPSGKLATTWSEIKK